MSSYAPAVCYLILTLSCVLALRDWLRRASTLPPGPPRGLFGDGREIPSSHPWKTFAEWHEKYGDVVSFNHGNTPVIVLGTFKAASDLLGKRAGIYSSRPRNIIAGEILSGGMRGEIMTYGTRWRNWRHLMHSSLNVNASPKYKPSQSMESSVLLQDLLTETDPTKYSSHIRRFMMSAIMSITHGRRIASLDDPVVAANMKADESLSRALVPGNHIAESWPILLYLPRMLQWFRHEPEKQRAADSVLYMSLMNNARSRVQRGSAQQSMAKLAFEKQSLLGLSDLETAYTLSSPWMAGVGSTTSTFHVFLMAMLHNPHVMHTLHAELDSVVGMDRLPTFDDEESLPYLQAVLKETIRWRPAAPLGVPHATISDDAYEGMYIPKGSTVYANIHAMSQDPKMFPEPNEFRPERFLNSTDPMYTKFTLGFGFGRRICPGMHVAQQSLFILMSRVLWAFEITPKKNHAGKPTLPSLDDFTTGVVIQPKPFQYLLIPRRENVARIIAEDAHHAASNVNACL